MHSIHIDKQNTDKQRNCVFIKQLFDSQTNIPGITYPHIELTYCKDYFSAKILLQTLLNEGWEIPSYTPEHVLFSIMKNTFPVTKCVHIL